jgi:two-component system, cell cycle response regulator DivK
VVEDEPDIASFLTAFFRASGTEVVSLDPTDAQDVVERAAELDVACMLVDLNLGGLSGFDVLEAVADDHRVASIPIVIVTADARSATQERAAALGAVGFVPKPFNVKDLFMTVQTLVDSDQTAHADDPSVALISADSLHARLDEAVHHARQCHLSTTFALIRLAGPAASPVVVHEVARRLEPAMPSAQVLGATAADELAVLFPSCGPAEAGSLVVGALGDGRLEVELAPGRAVGVDVRAGLAASPHHAATGDELYMAADTALAEAVDAAEPVVVAR